MPQYIPVEEFLKLARRFPVLDVRSPAEYAQAHIPGAFSFPLFDDQERAEIGTIYKQQSKELAVARGLEIVTPKMPSRLREAISIAGEGKEVLVHCWRGGMRSSSVADFLSRAGLKVFVLEKGYKAFRHEALQLFQAPWKLVVLGGKTGSGKTNILKELANRGHQVIDLEKLANHKGSAFGWMNQEPQPTSEQFENNLYMEMLKLDPAKPVWLEDESRTIGKVYLPLEFFAQIRSAQVIRLEIPQEVRIHNLILDYQLASKEDIRTSLLKIKKRLGAERTDEALTALDTGDYTTGARIALAYYDKAYLNGLSHREPFTVHKLELPSATVVENTNAVEKFFNEKWAWSNGLRMHGSF